jgi:hypothetical protein
MTTGLIITESVLAPTLVIALIGHGARINLERAHARTTLNRIVRIRLTNLLTILEPLHRWRRPARQTTQQLYPNTCHKIELIIII